MIPPYINNNCLTLFMGNQVELTWEKREFSMIIADIFCLQEIQYDHYDRFFRSYFEAGQLVRLKDKRNGREFCIINTHLLFNKRRGDPCSPMYNFVMNGEICFTNLRRSDISGQSNADGPFVSVNLPEDVKIARNCRFNYLKSKYEKSEMPSTVSMISTTSSMMPGSPRPIDRTPDENEFQMTLIPETKIIFMSADIGLRPTTVKVIIQNDTSLIQAFKVKCTANCMFTIRPSYGIIAPNEKKNIRITFKWKNVPKDDLHFISFYHIHVNKKTCNMTPREMFENFKPDGVKRIQCQFKYADGRPVHPPEPISIVNTVMMNPFDSQIQ